MPESNRTRALEAITIMITNGVSLLAAVRELEGEAPDLQTVVRTAQRIIAKVPVMDVDQASDAAYAAANWSERFFAVFPNEADPRKKRSTWERVEWMRFSTPDEPIEGRVEQRAVELRERRHKAPIARYEWRVQEDRPDGRRGFKTDAYPSRAQAEEVFGKWAARRRPRRPGTPRSPRRAR